MGLLVRERGRRDEDRKENEKNGGKERKERRKEGGKEGSEYSTQLDVARPGGPVGGIEPQLFQLRLAFLRLGPDWLSVDRIPSGLWELISINCCMHVPGNLKLVLVCMNKLSTACCGKLAFATILTRVNGIVHHDVSLDGLRRAICFRDGEHLRSCIT